MTVSNKKADDVPFTPLFARVLIEREVKEKTQSGIFIPVKSQKKLAPSIGVIRALGPLADSSLKVGDKVVFGKYAGAWLDEMGAEYNPEIEGESKWYVCQDEDVICKIAE